MEPLAQLLALELDYNTLPDADLAARRTALVDALDEASREPNPSSQFAGLAPPPRRRSVRSILRSRRERRSPRPHWWRVG